MLLTAQRIQSPSSGQHGVNVYQYLHGTYHWQRVPNEFLPDANPGELVEMWPALAPGGNRVLSFLDFVAPDDMDPLDLQQRLGALKHRLPHHEAQIYWDPCWARFGCAANIPRTTELGALAGHIVLCLSGLSPVPPVD